MRVAAGSVFLFTATAPTALGRGSAGNDPSGFSYDCSTLAVEPG